MEASPSALAKLLLPRTPFILKTALWHTLSLSDTASTWDLRTELTVKIMRDMLGPNSRTSPVGKMQHLTTKDPGVKGKVWVSKVSFPVPPEDDLRQTLFKAISDLKDSNAECRDISYEEPEAKGLEAEWHGYHPLAHPNDPEPPGLTSHQKYERLMDDTSSPITLLYFHGGAMYLLDPSTYRAQTAKLCKETGGRAFTVRYRLAPKYPFPAALLDALTAYLTLLYPPEGSLHEAVPKERIVFSGDSAGGTLCAALLQLILHLHRSSSSSSTIRWHGKEVELPLPAGVAMTSPWLDITRSLPSLSTLAKYDYLPTPAQTAGMAFPADDLWPVDPPRADMYAEASALCHPLVSPLAAKDWSGLSGDGDGGKCPVWFGMGQEMLRDEDAVVAKRIAQQGGTVVWREWEGMPHVFAFMLDKHDASKQFLEEFGRFCKGVVGIGEHGEDGMKGGVGIDSSAIFYKAKTLEPEQVGFDKLTDLSDERVAQLMREGKERLERRVDGSTEARPML
jgi:acetyl esterase/lipase